MKQTNQVVINALQDIINHPQHDERRIADYFAADYQQQVDGKRLDYTGFIQHMALLKAHTRRMRIIFLAVVGEGETVFTHHQVQVAKDLGAESVFEVLARFTLAGGRIIRCEELTRQIDGEPEDRDLGSRQ
ncbi:TPA: nuclear transport factor 2 family protein [Raoultella planticola]